VSESRGSADQPSGLKAARGARVEDARRPVAVGRAEDRRLIALGAEAVMAGYQVRYTLATKVVNELVEAA
jgi:hypothetical protein